MFIVLVSISFLQWSKFMNERFVVRDLEITLTDRLFVLNPRTRLQILRNLGREKYSFIYIYIYHQSKIYKSRYLLHYLQNTLRYYNFSTTRSNISCLPRGSRKEKKKRKTQTRTMVKKNIQKKGDLVAA